jgi:hypothetical protein
MVTPAVAASPHEPILAITTGFLQSRALAVAAELELAELLAEGPLHVDVLASRTNAYSPALFRLLRALETLRVFSQSAPFVFANTPSSGCLRRNVPNSQWAWVRTQLSVNGGVYEGWSGLRDSAFYVITKETNVSFTLNTSIPVMLAASLALLTGAHAGALPLSAAQPHSPSTPESSRLQIH